MAMADEQASVETEAGAASTSEMSFVEGSLAARMVQLDAAQPEIEEPGRRKRRTRSRARTISIRRLSKTELNRGREQYPEADYWRPKTRGDCMEIERP